MGGRNAQESHSLIISTSSLFNVNIVASYYNFSNNSHKATHMVIVDTNLGIEVTVNGAIMGSGPICNSMAERVRPLCGFLTLFESDHVLRSSGPRLGPMSPCSRANMSPRDLWSRSGKFWLSDPNVRPEPVFGLSNVETQISAIMRPIPCKAIRP